MPLGDKGGTKEGQKGTKKEQKKEITTKSKIMLTY